MKKQHLSAIAFATLSAIAISSCSDELENEQNRITGDIVSYSLNNDATTRTIGGEDAEPATWDKIEAKDDQGNTKYVLEINDDDTPEFGEELNATLNHNDPETRAISAKRSVEKNFTTVAYRGTATGVYTDKWFETTAGKDGVLSTTQYWNSEKPFGKFYGIYEGTTTAYSNAKSITKIEYTGDKNSPKITYTVNQYVQRQTSLMTAVSDEHKYTGKGSVSSVPMRFRNALASVRFKIGEDLAKDHVITGITIANVKYTGVYTVGSKSDHSGSSWNVANSKTTIRLNLNSSEYISTNGATGTQTQGALLVGSDATTATDDDEYTFMMIPQSFDNGSNKVTVTVNLRNTTTNTTSKIEFTLGAGNKAWKANKNTNYQISNDWTNGAVFSVTQPTTSVAYTGGASDNFTVRSYRLSKGGTLDQLSWKVIKYEFNDGNGNTTTSTTNTSTWFKNETSTGLGTNSTSENVTNTGNGTFEPAEVVDLKALYDSFLKGSTKYRTGDYHDLSLINPVDSSTRARSTANSYLITGPGKYKIPLVYGNAITGGQVKLNSYRPHTGFAVRINTAMQEYVLGQFVDHKGVFIYDTDNSNRNNTDPTINHDPWITSKYTISDQGILWQEHDGLVKNVGLEGGEKDNFDSYVTFEVDENLIENSNAVIYVKDSEGNYAWSWHLWFAKPEELTTAKFYHNGNASTHYPFNFAKANLGFVYDEWKGTVYNDNRSVTLTLEQDITGEQKTVTLTQSSYLNWSFHDTKYEWGRKDAFPGNNPDHTRLPRNLTEWTGFSSAILFPYGTSIIAGIGRWIANPSTATSLKGAYFSNLWSGSNFNLRTIGDGTTVKTIYDPSPAGFLVPPCGVFTGFSKTGSTATAYNSTELNVNGDFNKGYIFSREDVYSGASSTDVFFPATGYRNTSRKLDYAFDNSKGKYWSSDSYYPTNGRVFNLENGQIGIGGAENFYVECAVRPILEN